jgi:two-component system, LytTR family, response regulator
MIRAIIVEDEPKNLKILQSLIKKYCPEITLVGSTPNVDSAYQLILEENPDLLFLDIELIFGNAFDLLDKLKPLKFEVIFVTAYGDYALKALKYSALDYLLKPVKIEELKLAVQKAVDRNNLKDINDKLNNLLFNLRKPQETLARLALPTQEGLVFIPIIEIIRLQAQGGYTFVFTEKGKFVASKNIKEYEEVLPESMFCRVHHSHIINLNAVKNYQKGRGGEVVMTDGTRIEVATRRKEYLLQKLKQ